MDFFKSMVGGKPAQSPVAEDSDFADFAAAPAPSPMSIPSSPADAQAAEPTGATLAGHHPVVYTKWYRVWERTQLSDFYMEMGLLPIIFIALLVHFWGTKKNQRKARKWMAVHAPVLDSEFALVGFHQIPKITPHSTPTVQGGESLLQSSNKLTGEYLPKDMLKEKSSHEFEAYASGRQNVAFVDMKILLKRRMNPLMMLMEEGTGLFFDSVKPKGERMEAVMYTFDGKEDDFVPPAVPGSEEIQKPKKVGNSSYDPFVFAIVHKLAMRKLRDERYDLSLTFTKDNNKLPDWATVMSESAEVSDTLLTKDLTSAVSAAGDLFQYLIVSDQPSDKPTTLNETTPRKRIHLCLRLPSDDDYSSTLPLFAALLRLPDHLVNAGHFRPEVVKKVTQMRDAEKAKLKKVSDKEAEEDRQRALDKMKKDERDRKMKGMSAEEQRKFLERENEKIRKKQEKRMTRKG